MTSVGWGCLVALVGPPLYYTTYVVHVHVHVHVKRRGWVQKKRLHKRRLFSV